MWFRQVKINDILRIIVGAALRDDTSFGQTDVTENTAAVGECFRAMSMVPSVARNVIAVHIGFLPTENICFNIFTKVNDMPPDYK